MGFDETFRQLSDLLQAEAGRRESALRDLRSAVSRLDGGFLPPDEPAERDEGGRARRMVQPPVPFVPLPSRTTHGGRFGPAVRAKLIAEALRR